MRKFTTIAVGILWFFTLYCGISHAASTGIADSSHDLSRGSQGSESSKFMYATSQTCVFCHTPHGANSDVRADTHWDKDLGYVNGTGAPLLLWNRSIKNADSPTFELYASSTSVPLTQVRVHSLLCLSCHDGVGALNVVQNFPADGVDREAEFGAIDWYQFGKPIGQRPNQIGDTWDNGINIGGRTPLNGQAFVELRDDHPISVNYDAAYAQDNNGMVLKTTAGGVEYVGDPKLKLYSGYVECSTCHDPHNEGEASTGFKYPFLWVDNAGSNLCLQCHNK